MAHFTLSDVFLPSLVVELNQLCGGITVQLLFPNMIRDGSENLLVASRWFIFQLVGGASSITTSNIKRRSKGIQEPMVHVAFKRCDLLHRLFGVCQE